LLCTLTLMCTTSQPHCFRCLQLLAQLFTFGTQGAREGDGFQGRWLLVHDLTGGPILIERPGLDGAYSYVIMNSDLHIGPEACPGAAFQRWQEEFV